MHALIEKPLTTDVESAHEIAEAFAAAGLVGAVGHIERYNPALQQARARIANGDLGEIYQITTRRQGPFPGRIADVGVILDLATHDIDLTAWVAQQPFASVAARTAHRSGRPHEDLVVDHRPARRRHRHQSPGQLAVADEGAGHGHHRREGRPRRRHPDAPTSPSTRTASSRPSGARWPASVASPRGT